MLPCSGLGFDGVPLPPAFSDTFASSHVDTGAVRLHAVVGGTGPPLLLLHGWLQSWYAWRLVMPALATSSTVVAADIRGAGRSGKPPHGYDTGTLAADSVELMRRLGFPRFAVAGHDVGAWIAYAMAADHPERVERLAVVEGVPPGVAPVPPLTGARSLPAAMVRHYAHQLAGDVDAVWAGFAYHLHLDDTTAQNRRRLDRPLSQPVLAVGGESYLCELVPAAMRRAAVDVTEVIIADCGHYPPEERPDELITRLFRFLDRAGPGPRP
jgi:pimeloyl-ACP methyl ester carboxylesterase